ncbi:MAG: permease [Leptospirales bacterium]
MALLGLFAGALLLTALYPRELWPALRSGAFDFVRILPVIVLSAALAAFTRASGADRPIAGLARKRGNAAGLILLASIFGALSPFCSCGVVPIIAGLLGAGVSLAPVMAFWLASPVMAPDMFLITASELGLPFALGKTAAALGVGVLGGFATLALTRAGLLQNPLRIATDDSPNTADATSIEWFIWRDPERLAAFRASLVRVSLFLLQWLALAFVLESLLIAFVPAEWIARAVGGDHWWSIPVAALVGVPAYVNGYAAVPVVSGLLKAGMSPGAAMAFMTAGAMSSIPAALAVAALVRRPVFGLYLALAFAGALLAGVSYEVATRAADANHAPRIETGDAGFRSLDMKTGGLQ